MCNVQMISFTETVITSKFIFFDKTIILTTIIKRFPSQMTKVDSPPNNPIPASRNVSFLTFSIRNLIYSPCSFFSYTVEWTISSKRHLDSPPLFYIATKEQQISFTLDIKVRSELDLNYKIRLKGAGLFLF